MFDKMNPRYSEAEWDFWRSMMKIEVQLYTILVGNKEQNILRKNNIEPEPLQNKHWSQ